MIVYHGTAGKNANGIRRRGLKSDDPGGPTVTTNRSVARTYALARTAHEVVHRDTSPIAVIVTARIDPERLSYWECCPDGDRTACSNRECLIHDDGYGVPGGIEANELTIKQFSPREFRSQRGIIQAYMRLLNWPEVLRIECLEKEVVRLSPSGELQDAHLERATALEWQLIEILRARRSPVALAFDQMQRRAA